MQLLASDYTSDMHRNPKRVPGTCDWFLKHDTFDKWCGDRSQKLLLVYADPGCGKSVLARALVDEGHLSAQPSDITCYFFFKEDDVERRSGADALCAILHQLFTKIPELLTRYALPHFNNNGEKLRTMFGTLWGILMDATADGGDPGHDIGRITCVLDALDECEAPARDPLIQKLSELHLSRYRTTSRVRFVVTSRPYADIQHQFRFFTTSDLSPSVYLEGETETRTIKAEIDLYILDEVRRIADARDPPVPSAIWESLVEHLKGFESRTYLWLHLVLHETKLSLEYTASELEKLVYELPGSVDKAYDDILQRATTPRRGGKRDEERVRKLTRVLHLVVAADRPLTLRELNITLGILERTELGDPCLSDAGLDVQDPVTLRLFEQKIRNLCGLFISIVDSRISLIHQTAREFLISRIPNMDVRGELPWKSLLRLTESNRLLALACMSYLSLLQSLFLELWKQESKEAGEDVKAINLLNLKRLMLYPRKYGFINYAANHWASHLRRAQMTSRECEIACDVCATKSRQFWTVFWHSGYQSDFLPLGWTDLMTASHFGLCEVMRLLIQKGAKVDAAMFHNSPGFIHGLNGSTALHEAAREGHEDAVRMLLDHGAAVNAQSKSGTTPLSLAAQRGHIDVVQLLVKRKADLNITARLNHTPLEQAILNRHESVAEFLLHKGARWRLRRWSSHPLPHALEYAAKRGLRVVVQLLLEIIATQPDSESDTILTWAANNGYEATVKQPLD